MRLLTRLGLVALLALGLAACASASTPAPAVSTAPASASAGASAVAGGSAGGDAVTIQNFAFAPTSLDVAVGATVTWTNKDSATHTVTADDASFDGQLPSGQTFSQTFAKAGTFTYHCKIHPSMKATITVR